MAVATTSKVFEFCQVTTAAASAPIVPSQILPPPGPGTPSGIGNFPFGNTRTIVILNTGGNPLLFSVTTYSQQSLWPSNLGGTGAALNLTEGFNATRIPVGASLSIDLGSYQERGNFTTAGFNQAAPVPPPPSAFPFNLITFASTAAGVTTADITYIARLGAF
jgi:hypothetical protein